MYKMQKCKTYLMMLMMLFAINMVNAQDIITKTNGEKIKAKVEEVTENTIKYRNASNPKGPLYSISISSISSIQYENGSVDEFDTPLQESTTITQSPSKNEGASDEELLKIAGYNNYTTEQSGMSDSELTKLYNRSLYGYDPNSYESQMTKAKKFKRIGWIGGASLACIGIIVGAILDYQWGEEFYMTGIAGGIGLGAGAIWCGAFHLASNNIIKNARKREFLSVTLFENQIYQFSNAHLYAGVDLLGNRISNDHTLGLSLKFNF